MKNLYEILEVDKDASDEIIKVAYKSLVKKYHPDLKEGSEKLQAEQKIKEINDAYDVLSSSSKRAEYDQFLASKTVPIEQYNLVVQENMKLKDTIQKLTNSNFYTKAEQHYSTPRPNKVYNTPSSNTNSNYTKSEKNNAKNFFDNMDENLKTVISILLTFLIIFIILSIPFIRNSIITFFGSGYIFLIIIVVIFYIYFFRNRK